MPHKTPTTTETQLRDHQDTSMTHTTTSPKDLQRVFPKKLLPAYFVILNTIITTPSQQHHHNSIIIIIILNISFFFFTNRARTVVIIIIITNIKYLNNRKNV
jgi:hypothetical protein